MSLRHAILGFLSFEDMNGYQLKKHFDESVDKFWSVSISQIYPTLNEMLKAGLIAVKDDGSKDSRGSKTYRITEKGEQELKGWLSQPMLKEPIRSEMLLKLYFSSKLEDSEVIGHFEKMKEEACLRLDLYEAYLQHIETEHKEGLPFYREATFWRMTVRHGIIQEQAFLQWCDECIDALKSL